MYLYTYMTTFSPATPHRIRSCPYMVIVSPSLNKKRIFDSVSHTLILKHNFKI